MTASLSGLFRSLFPAIVLTLCLVVLGGAGGYYLTTGAALTAVVLAFAGLALVIALFGLVALQIENNEMLYRIAVAMEAQGWEGRDMQAPQDEALADAQPPAAGLIATRVGAAARGEQAEAQPRPRGRVEPVVTLRSQPVSYGV